MKQGSRIIALCGPESTGKSTLSNYLASAFDAYLIDEIARRYVEKLPLPYTYSDVEQIAQLQIAALDEALRSEPKLIVMDTWLIITKVWFQVVYGNYPNWLEEAIRRVPIDHYLLCAPDIPWVYDPVRENPDNREELFQRYLAEIQHYGFSFTVIEGDFENRQRTASTLVSSLI